MDTLRKTGEIQGYGVDAFPKKNSLVKDIPKLSNDSVVGESSIIVDRHQWIDLGPHQNTCLGNIAICHDGFTFATFFKINVPHTRRITDYHTLFINGGYRRELNGVSLAVNSPDSNSMYIRWGVWLGTRDWSMQSATYVNNPNDWHHIAITWSKANTLLKLYLDGNVIVTTTRSSMISSGRPNDDFNVAIGGYPDQYSTTTSHYMTGYLDDVYIWYSTQTDATIKYLYEQRPNEDTVLCECDI